MTETKPDNPPLDPEFLKILICPVTRSSLRQEGDDLIGTVGGLRYPIRDGMPVLLPDAATLPEGFDDLEQFKAHYRDQIPDDAPTQNPASGQPDKETDDDADRPQ